MNSRVAPSGDEGSKHSVLLPQQREGSAHRAASRCSIGRTPLSTTAQVGGRPAI